MVIDWTQAALAITSIAVTLVVAFMGVTVAILAIWGKKEITAGIERKIEVAMQGYFISQKENTNEEKPHEGDPTLNDNESF